MVSMGWREIRITGFTFLDHLRRVFKQWHYICHSQSSGTKAVVDSTLHVIAIISKILSFYSFESLR